ncbi:unnamed protein product [Durusdinium trenchii]|uniref:Uncharacterized protein n=1 Tax=Durusdinium trenchii TaxID=1381693 RepID=A0ABP0QNM0_9DINO
MAGAPVHHRLQVLELSSELQTTELRWLMGRMADAEVARSESSLTKSQKARLPCECTVTRQG